MPTHRASLDPETGPALDPTAPAYEAVPEPRAELPAGGQPAAAPADAGAPPGHALGDPVFDGRSGDDLAAAWGHGEPGSIYDYIRVAAFAIGPDGRISQWSDRAAEFFGITADEAVGCDPVTTFTPRELWRRGQDRMTEILGGQEWVGTAPYRDSDGKEGVAELYLMPALGEDGRRGVVCMAVDLRKLRRIETDLAASEAVFGQAPTGFVLFDRALTVQRVNESFAEGLGLTPADLNGMTAVDLLPRPEAERLQQALHRVLETGDPVVDLRFNGTLPTKPGRRRWSISLYRLLSSNNRTMGVAGQVIDVTGRQRAEREAASARRSLALLNEAGAHIGSTLDLEVTAKELLDVAVPGFCDIATVDLYSGVLADTDLGPGHPSARTDGAGELRRVASASTVGYHAVPGVLPGPRAEVGGSFCYPPRSPYAKALRTGRSLTLNSPGNPDPDPMVQGTVVVPMVARDTVLGLVQLSRTKGSEPFDSRDVAIATELVARAAVCIDNARLYRREHERALILQRSLLPPGNPAASGLEIACRYRPGSSGTEVGGDWFDVIQLPGNRTALVIGDVMGRGLRAAVAMGQLRTAVRTLAMLDLDPAEVLTALDEIARGLNDGTNPDSDPDSGLDELYLATCVYAVYDAVTLRCTFANAGHLPPVLVSPGGEARMLDEFQPGLPLGVGGEPFEEFTVDIPDGALLSLYTDGLVESRKHQLEEGLSALRRTLSGPTTRPLENLCDHLLTALDPHHGEDDIALLMARVHALPEDAVGDWTLPSEPTSVARARELACAWLLARGLDDLIDTTELLVSELATNALRHGRGDIRLRLLRDTTLVCEVWDNGYAQPRQRRARDTDEGGRGLQLVSMLADRWGSRRTPSGKTVWFELALPAVRQ
ncbi:SpoIIE family protein phosphatase [Streptacidiphilus sp. P02-A3a]|uniref:SpoIIE family protein phosphatase n=1 Tax=Streptacidiphilus sp. P02-A3a TaxID=2704468 RepID=UPI0015FE4E67|nr:SpoIIE family protein phosphatase [Streptacidiphilus sp. P02-A3a]QMU67695.1 SpoIIE family protein phosphatase [Streptacidiphilus sp. P02-A3a]